METVQCYCNNCGEDRQHVLIFHTQHSQDFETSDPGFFVSDTHNYWLLQCGGCRAVVLKHSKFFSEDEEDVITYHPGPTPLLPKWHWQFVYSASNSHISFMLREIYGALSVQADTLAAMGLRNLLEFVMVSKVGEHRTFEATLAAFHAAKFVTDRERDRIAKLLDLGHAAMHRTYRPSHDDVLKAVRAVEALIEKIYEIDDDEHDDAVELLSQKVPKRVKPSKKA